MAWGCLGLWGLPSSVGASVKLAMAMARTGRHFCCYGKVWLARAMRKREVRVFGAWPTLFMVFIGLGKIVVARSFWEKENNRKW